MLSLIAIRALLVALPFALWFAWVWWARRSGREVAATPWIWLVGAGGVLVGLSLMATAVFREDNRAQTYVPPVVAADGSVIPGHFEEKK